MKCDEVDSPAFVSPLHNVPYGSSLATSASSSSSSVWSDASSQSSEDTAISAPDSCDPCYSRPAQTTFSQQRMHEPAVKLTNPWLKQQTQLAQAEVPAELRQNPRRTSCGSVTRSGCPPSLVRQADRKVNFVDNLVDSSTQIVEAIWPTSSINCRTEAGNGGVLPLRTFIQETLRRSRTSYSTLQVALYYLILIKAHVPTHDFTMEQPNDCHASRALQCGRRMFLAALILASKYLQDRNYSARAWSKISGLNTQEINQNEMAFLLAVNWKLHITDEVYARWTDCVMKHTPSQPPSPGGTCAQRIFERQCSDFKTIILKLTPELDNLADIVPFTPVKPKLRDIPAVSPRALFLASADKSSSPLAFDPNDATTPTTPRSRGTPNVIEPTPAAVYTPGRLAPALGLLPTPRLTPQSIGMSTPAVSAVSQLLSKGAMGLAMAQASSHSTASQILDRWPVSTTSSPQSYFTARRSSLANSISTAASSPESMVSDTSRSSRSSSSSSASSSLVSAPSSRLDVQARCRYAKLCGERTCTRPTVALVPEDYEESCVTSSPESYTGNAGGKDMGDLSSSETPLARRECEMDDAARDSVNDAARALQDLHNHHYAAQPAQTADKFAPVAGSKRSRPLSMENGLQENVRHILGGTLPSSERAWSDKLVRSQSGLLASGSECCQQQVPVRAPLQGGGRKRVCCSTEASMAYASIQPLHPAIGGLGGPRMWEGILN